MSTIKLKTGEVIHDFRPHKTGWGWNGMSINFSKDGKTGNMLGIGKGLKVGDFVALRYGEDDCGHKIVKVEYETNPSDMFRATLSGWYGFDEGDLN